MMSGNGAPGFTEGQEYECRVKSVQALESDSSNNPYLDFELVVLNGEMAGEMMHYKAVYTEARKKRFARELAAVGFNPQEGMEWDGLPEIVVGKECVVTMRRNEFNGKVTLQPDNMKRRSAAGEAGGILGRIAAAFGGHVTGKPAAIKDKVPF